MQQTKRRRRLRANPREPWFAGQTARPGLSVDSMTRPTYEPARAQVAELVDALVSGTSGASREGSSPFLGTITHFQCGT